MHLGGRVLKLLFCTLLGATLLSGDVTSKENLSFFRLQNGLSARTDETFDYVTAQDFLSIIDLLESQYSINCQKYFVKNFELQVSLNSNHILILTLNKLMPSATQTHGNSISNVIFGLLNQSWKK